MTLQDAEVLVRLRQVVLVQLDLGVDPLSADLHEPLVALQSKVLSMRLLIPEEGDGDHSAADGLETLILELDVKLLLAVLYHKRELLVPGGIRAQLILGLKQLRTHDQVHQKVLSAPDALSLHHVQRQNASLIKAMNLHDAVLVHLLRLLGRDHLLVDDAPLRLVLPDLLLVHLDLLLKHLVRLEPHPDKLLDAKLPVIVLVHPLE